MKKTVVYLGKCDSYDPDAIYRVIQKALGVIPFSKQISGNVVIKPNLVMAHPKVAPEAYTRKEVIEAILMMLQKNRNAIAKVDIVEKSGLGVTTGTMFRNAGYPSLKRKYKVSLRAMEEGRQSKVILEAGKVHRYITVAREMAERNFLIFAPKLKTNVLSESYSGALKLNIGTVDGKERMFHHHRDLPIKIVDILEIANPDLIVTDGIRMSFGGNQMTQHGIDVGVIVVSNNAVAHDMISTRLLNLDPMQIGHIREAIDRRYGPKSIDEIEVLGDCTISEIQAKTSGLDFGYYPVEQFQSNLCIHSGTPYCIGGCHGVFLDWLHMIRDRKPKLLKRFPKMDVLIGRVQKAIQSKQVLLVGNCAAASPSIRARRLVWIRGCPPSHKVIVLKMMLHFLLLAPLVRPDLIVDSFVLYPMKKLKGWFVNFRYRSSKKVQFVPELKEEQ